MNEVRWRELVGATLKGDKSAFEKLYRETERAVYFTCLKLLKNEDTARDIMQDTYMTALEKLSYVDDGAKFPMWINRIAINKCKDHFKKAGWDSIEEQLEQGTEIKDDESFIPEEYVTDETRRRLIMRIIDETLSDVQRQTIILYYYDEMSLEEIAEAMDCPVKTVSSRLCSARDKIKEAVLIYEREQGDRLHVMVPLPILTRILIKEASSISVPDISQVLMSASFFNAASASASTVSTSIAGGSTKMGLLTGKVIAGITAGIIATGGITAAVVLNNKGSGTGNTSAVSAGEDKKSENKTDDKIDNKDKADNDKTDNENEESGSGESKKEKKPFEVTYAEVPEDEYIPFYENLWFKMPEELEPYGMYSAYTLDGKRDSEYGIVTVRSYDTYEIDGTETPEQIRDKFLDDFDIQEVFNLVEGSPYLMKANAETSGKTSILGDELLKETGTLELSDMVNEQEISYSAVYGILSCPENTKDMQPEDIVYGAEKRGVMFLAFSTENSAAKKEQLSGWIDYITSNFEDPTTRYVDLLPDDGYTAESDGSEVKGKVKKEGAFEVFVPDGWTIEGPGGPRDPEWGVTLYDDSDPHAMIQIRFSLDERLRDWYYPDIKYVRDKHSMTISDAQTVDEFTCGDFTFEGIKYNKILEDNAVYPVGRYYDDKGSGKIDLHISTIKYDEDTPEFQAVVRSLKITP